MLSDLLLLAERYGELTGLSHWQIGLSAARSAKFFRDLRSGRRRGCTVATHARAVHWFSNHWPEDAEWPPNIPRPATTATQTEHAITQTAPPASDPVAAARGARDRMLTAHLADDDTTAEAAEAEALRIGMQLNASGRIASPAALCAALGLSRKTYENVVARYAHGRRVPRSRNSATARMLIALNRSGDVRFVNPSTRKESAA